VATILETHIANAAERVMDFHPMMELHHHRDSTLGERQVWSRFPSTDIPPWRGVYPWDINSDRARKALTRTASARKPGQTPSENGPSVRETWVEMAMGASYAATNSITRESY
jgi:hypothetical protein